MTEEGLLGHVEVWQSDRTVDQGDHQATKTFEVILSAGSLEEELVLAGEDVVLCLYGVNFDAWQVLSGFEIDVGSCRAEVPQVEGEVVEVTDFFVKL